MKLITMTDFVLEQEQYRLKNILPYPKSLSYDKILNYANFLKQPLTLGMFVPCDENGHVYVDYRTYSHQRNTICEPYEGLFEVYKKSKDVEKLNGDQIWKDDQRYYNKRKYLQALKKYEEAKERVLFESNWKHKKEPITRFDTVDDDDFHFNLDTLECWQWVEGGILDFKLTGCSIEAIANIVKGIKLTDSAIKQLCI